MTVAKSLKKSQSLSLDISNANLSITPEQLERLCLDNPDLQIELATNGQLVLAFPAVASQQEKDLVTKNSTANESAVKQDFLELTAEETARRIATVEKFTKRKRQRWDNMTPAERTEHDRQFNELYQLLAESRR